ncbi:MAG: hypothetical protein RMY34_01015 [Aulosira sp. DedQUE10]|nr:hypothetical protein [Aulosira sp. DedQUE10]
MSFSRRKQVEAFPKVESTAYTSGECITLLRWFTVESAPKLQKTANGV